MHKVLVVAALFLAGCGPTVSGTVGGRSVQVTDAVFGLQVVPASDANGYSYNTIQVWTSSFPGLCDWLTTSSPTQKANATVLNVLAMHSVKGQSAAPPWSAGTYTISDPNSVSSVPSEAVYASFVATDATCATVVGPTTAPGTGAGKSGTFVINTFTSDKLDATVDAIFPSGGEIKGGFTATHCAGLDAPAGTRTPSPVCEK